MLIKRCWVDYYLLPYSYNDNTVHSLGKLAPVDFTRNSFILINRHCGLHFLWHVSRCAPFGFDPKFSKTSSALSTWWLSDSVNLKTQHTKVIQFFKVTFRPDLILIIYVESDVKYNDTCLFNFCENIYIV